MFQLSPELSNFPLLTHGAFSFYLLPFPSYIGGSVSSTKWARTPHFSITPPLHHQLKGEIILNTHSPISPHSLYHALLSPIPT
jgi:hypothetical protein